MFRYVIKRIIMIIPVMIGVMLIVFIFQAISPDDPVQILLGPTATEADKLALSHRLGLDRPIIVQFLSYVWNFFTKFDLGNSYTSGQPVMREILLRLPYTVKISIWAVLFGVLIGVPLGVVSAVKQYTFVDNAILGFSVFLSSFPNFWLALLLIIVFSVRLGWLPSNGVADWRGWVLPLVVVAFQTMVQFTRTTRSSMLETIRQDYVRTARAKGQPEKDVILKHVVRNSLIPVVNAIGVSIGVQLGGALIIETVFGIPGIGQYAIAAIGTRDYPAVLGGVVILAFLFSVVNLIIDICYTFVDPKLVLSFTLESEIKRQKRLARRKSLRGESTG